jgi:hypothetical protein
MKSNSGGKIIHIDEVLSSSDDVGLIRGKNTLNTSLNETFLFLLFGRCKGAEMVCYEGVGKEKMDALRYLMRKKMDALNECLEEDTYFQFKADQVYLRRKKEELCFPTIDYLPIEFKKEGIYLVPAYLGNIRPTNTIRNINCSRIFEYIETCPSKK